MAVETSLVREKVAQDKKLAAEVLHQTKQELSDFHVEPPVRVDMQGTNIPAIRGFYNYKQEQHDALWSVQRDLYFSRVDTEVGSGDDDRGRFLLTKTRLQTTIIGDEWTVVPWTNPLAALFRGRKPGDVVTFDGRRPPVQHKILETVQFGAILPTVLQAEYRLKEGDRFIADEKELETPTAEVPPPATTKPEEEYRATGEFGLGEIIELADATQYQAMQLPFGETVLIEGPPGSGKTSIGLMRIPCLLDQQWDELGLNRERDRPFHTKSSIRVLVMNEEMIEYLQRLIRQPAIGLDYVPVQTLTEFCRGICRDAGVLRGKPSQETPALTALKLHPFAIPAFASGFQQWVRRWWDDGREALTGELTAKNASVATRVVQAIDSWVVTLTSLALPSVIWEGAPNLAGALHTIFTDEIRRLGSASAPRGGMSLQEQGRYESERRERDTAAAGIRELAEQVAGFAKGFFNRKEIVREMLGTPAFDTLLRGFTDERRVSKADLTEEWAAQTEGDVQRLSSGDFALTAWLAAHVAMIRTDGPKPVFGGIAPQLTHVVIDEAQDVGLPHVGLIRRLLTEKGTMTLVGDLRQRVSHRGHFRHWDDFGLPTIKHAVFGVNYRQSKPIGDYVRAIHGRLFGDPPPWRASDRVLGEKPRVRKLRGSRALASTIAEEITFWRREIPKSTVAVLYHGKWGGAKTLQSNLEDLLQESLIEVHLAKGAGRNDALRRTDCAMIATVAGTKGLEFDAVILIDPAATWGDRPRKMAGTKKNALYVATSRPKQGLSVILDRNTRWHRTGLLKDLVTVIKDDVQTK
jgi:hypothetical protein